MTISLLIEKLLQIEEKYGDIDVAFIFDEQKDESQAVTITYAVDAQPFEFADDKKQVVAGLIVPYSCDCPDCNPPGPIKKNHLSVVQ